MLGVMTWRRQARQSAEDLIFDIDERERAGSERERLHRQAGYVGNVLPCIGLAVVADDAVVDDPPDGLDRAVLDLDGTFAQEEDFGSGGDPGRSAGPRAPRNDELEAKAQGLFSSALRLARVSSTFNCTPFKVEEKPFPTKRRRLPFLRPPWRARRPLSPLPGRVPRQGG
jgi:hypothetical protein